MKDRLIKTPRLSWWIQLVLWLHDTDIYFIIDGNCIVFIESPTYEISFILFVTYSTSPDNKVDSHSRAGQILMNLCCITTQTQQCWCYAMWYWLRNWYLLFINRPSLLSWFLTKCNKWIYIYVCIYIYIYHIALKFQSDSVSEMQWTLFTCISLNIPR